MIDVRTEIAALAFVNAQIIQEAERTRALIEPTRRVEKMYGFPAGSLRLVNPAHLIGLLYCLFVVPKELWVKDGSYPVFSDIEPDKFVGLISVSKKTVAFDRNPGYQLLRHLRNSIAHVRFTLIGDKFEFWDIETKTRQEIFRGACSLAELSELVSHVGAILANLRNKPFSVH